MTQFVHQGLSRQYSHFSGLLNKKVIKVYCLEVLMGQELVGSNEQLQISVLKLITIQNYQLGFLLHRSTALSLWRTNQK